MSITKVSKFVLEDNTVTFEKLAITEGAAGQVISVDENNQLSLTDRFTQEEIEDITAALLLRGNHTNLSIAYSDTNNQLNITAHVNHPTEISAFNNDVGYLTTHQDLSAYALTAQLFSGSYNDLTNKPTIPSNVSDLTNDSGYITSASVFSGDYTDLTNKPTIPSNVSDLTNDSGYLTSYTDTIYSVATSSTLGLVKIGYEANSKNYPVEISSDKMFVTVPWTDTDTNTTYTAGSGLTLTSTSFSVDSTIASKTYVDNAISDIVNGADAAFDTLSEIQNAMATDVELSTAIGNLSIPSNVSDLINDSGYLTTHQDLSAYALTTQLFSGSYNDLTDTPTIPTIPTNVSSFTNDAEYLTDDTMLTDYGLIADSSVYGNGSNISSSITNVSSLNNDAGYISSTNTPVSTFNNDAGYITSVSINDLTDVNISNVSLVDNQFLRWNGYNAWINETIKISYLENDRGFITFNDLPAGFSGYYDDLNNKPDIPTNVSELINDSGYLTSYNDTTYSTATPSTLGLVKIGYSENGKNYPVELSSGKMFVNVPWTDTDTNSDTTYTAGTGLTLTSTEFSVDSTIAPKTYVDNAISNLVNGANSSFDTLKEIQDAMATDAELATAINNLSIPSNYMVNDADNTVSGSQIPSTDSTYDLGSETQQWRTIYGHEVESTYADLAERYEADKKLAVGTVVVFGGDKEVTECLEAMDVSVAGIISGKPALKMNSDAGSDDTHPYIALKGRVPCQVIGRVHKGDLLVTSSTPGFAKSVGKVDMGLAVFAKAIETNLEDGEKLVEVVVI